MNLKSFFHKPVRGVNIDKLLRYQLQWMMMLRIVLYTSILGISFLFRSYQYKLITLPDQLSVLFLLVVYSSTIASYYYLSTYKVNIQYFGFIQYLLDTFFSSVLVYFTGASQSIFSSVYFFPIIAGGLLLARQGGLISAAAATIQYGLTLFLEYLGLVPSFLYDYGFVPEQNFTIGLNRFSVMGLTFFLAATLSGLFAGRLKSTEDALSNTMDNYDKLSLRYKDIFDHIATGIITINHDGFITSVNNATTMITGFSVKTLTGTKFLTHLPNFDLDTTNTRLATNLIRKDGVKVRIGYSSTILHQPNENQENEDGLLPLSDDFKIITIQDISEVERLERQMRHAEKLAAIGRMSASIAHDFRNPLTAISGSAQLLEREFMLDTSEESSAHKELINIIRRESVRLNNTITDFLRFSRPESAALKWFSLKACVEEVLQVCQADPSWPPTCIINRSFDDTISLWADHRQIFTILSQLLHNSIIVCPERKEVISIDAEEINHKDRADEIVIRISDNGPGIKEEDWEKIFEPFYTTRPDGTGLGLAIVKQMVEEHKGQITVGNTSKGGALFSIYLPLPANK